MKNIYLLISLLFLFSCGNEKVVQLPEINHSNISEIQDVSAAYLFYDASNQEGYELNRKNLISSTNWLVNVDKRLTLKQVIPQIKFLQNKKQTSSHKNENAKNYFTCNDISKKTLGFIEFTDVVYNEESPDFIENISPIRFDLDGNITITNPTSEPSTIMTNKKDFIHDLKKMDTVQQAFHLMFNAALSFQDYIAYKSALSTSDFKYITLSNQEFLHN
jgi:hypothetical protein